MDMDDQKQETFIARVLQFLAGPPGRYDDTVFQHQRRSGRSTAIVALVQCLARRRWRGSITVLSASPILKHQIEEILVDRIKRNTASITTMTVETVAAAPANIYIFDGVDADQGLPDDAYIVCL